MVELLVVLPTLNERQNVGVMAERISAALTGVSYRIIYVDDDSTDGTRDELLRLAEVDEHIGFIHRMGRSGLSSAVIEGALAGTSRYIVVMDADLQHDEKLLPKMLQMLKTEPLDIVIASRFAPGASLGDFAESRVKTSERGIMLAQQILAVPVTDPLTGYFMMRREFFEGLVPNLQPRGFKILLDILHKAGAGIRYREIPLVFGTRLAGESKLDASVGFDYLAQLYEAKFENYLPLSVMLAAVLSAIVFCLAGGVILGTQALGVSGYLSSLLALILPVALTFRLKLNGLRKRQRPKGTDLAKTFGGYCALVLVNAALTIILTGDSAPGNLSVALLTALGLTGSALIAYFSYPIRARRSLLPKLLGILDSERAESVAVVK